MSKSENLNLKIFERLKEEIMNLELVPGQAISENEICKRFSVSRTPVRDALWRLQELGFVTTIPYRGTYVTKLNFEYIKQMIFMRNAVETMIICDFMDVATPMIMEEVRYMIRKQEAIILEKDFTPEKFYRLDSKMHEIWFDVTGKKKIWEVLQDSQLHYTRYRLLDFETETNFTRIIREHYDIFEFIEKKDKHSLMASLKAHLYYSIIRMKDQIEGEYQEYFDDVIPSESKL